MSIPFKILKSYVTLWQNMCEIVMSNADEMNLYINNFFGIFIIFLLVAIIT